MLRWVLIVLVDVDTHHQTKMCLLLLLLPNIYPFSGHSCYVFLSPVSRLKLVIMLGLKLNTRTWILMSVVLIITTGISDESTEPDVEGEALLDVLRWLNDTKGRITDWNFNFVSPCSSWSHVTCRDSHVITLSLASIGFSGTLSPAIARLQYLTTLDLHDNRLTGSLPDYIANLTRLQYLNLANNRFTSSIPSSWARLSSLKHLVLRENPITGTIPDSIASISGLTQLDLSSTGLSGTIPSQLYSALEFNFTGTSLSCGASLKKPCASNYPRQGLFVRKSKVKGVLTSATCGALLVFLAGGVVAYRYQRHWNKLKRDVFFDVAGVEECEISLGQVRRFSLREVQVATENFSEGKVIGQGGFGKVYKGELADKTQVAVKRLGDCFSPGGEAAFLREVQLISVAVHRNLLRLIGFCTTPSERILVYPFMPMLSVAFRLREAEEGLDWARRHRIAVGSARGLEYLHEQRIIHRDLKAANILLDAQLEPVLGDFGLAKPLDPTLTHVTTQVRGTMGHIAPEYLSTGKSSHKTDVFGYGITLLELVTGQRAIDFSRLDDVLLLDHIKKAQREKRVDSIVDSRLRSYDAKEVETVVKVALLCTQASPEDRPTMTQVLKMLDGVGLSQRWAHWEQLDHLRAPHDLSLYSHHFAWADDSTHDHQPIHLSKPR